MDTYLVTGGAGFIGANFVRLALARTPARVAVFDKLTYAGNLRNLEDVRQDPRYSFMRGDIAERDALDAAFATFAPSAVVNFAAESHVDRSIDGPGEFVHTNIVGTFELLQACRRHLDRLDAPARTRFRFLHVSTDEVYGSLGATGLFSEDTPYAPNSPYAASKASADHLVRAWHETFGVPSIITNCSNNYGPWQFPEKLIPLMILNAAEARDLPVYGDGAHVRDWLYVEDHCEGILAGLRTGVVGDKYNLGGRSERTNLEIVHRICDALEAAMPAAGNAALAARGKRDYRSLVTFVADRTGHDRRYAIDPTKAERDLAWRPRHDLDTGLVATVRWYLAHREWCDAVQAEGQYGRERLGGSPKIAGTKGAGER